MNNHTKKITIIGAGIAGCFLAINLAKKGYSIEIFESRPDSRKTHDEGRSYNLTLYKRGETALKRLGLWNDILPFIVPVKGNVCHLGTDTATYSGYNPSIESLYTVHRQSLVNTLLTIVERYPQVSVHFYTSCVKIDKKTKEVTYYNAKTKRYFSDKTDLVIGCDGVNSVVRSEMQRGEKAEHRQEFIEWGYKEVTIAKEHAGFLKEQSLHTWPRTDLLIIGFPNTNGSYTLMLNFPLKGKESYETLTSKKVVLPFLKKYFPDLHTIHAAMADAIITKPAGKFVTIYTSPWYFSDFIVLVGDSAHGVIPFYGQGMSSALEDCEVLLQKMNRFKNNLDKAFMSYQEERKKHTDVLGKLSQENFIELKEKDASVFFVTQKKIETILSRHIPFLLPPLYILVAHTTIPYADALKRYKNQKKLLRLFGIDIFTLLISFPQLIRHFFKGEYKAA